MTAKIVVTSPIFPEVAERLGAYGRLTVNSDSEPWSADRIAAELADADAMLAFMPDRVDGPLLSQSPRLKIIACALKGYDNFDVTACTQAGVWLSIVPDLLTIPTAELAVALVLGLNRKILPGDAVVRSGGFRGWRATLYGLGLDGATVGLLGYGKVGRAIAERLQGFGARLIVHDHQTLSPADRGPDVEEVDLDALAARADVIIVALPLTAQSFHLVDAPYLARMRPHVHLVNVGRGSVVDEAAVAAALTAGRIGGYAADVFELEDWARGDQPERIPQPLLAMSERTLFTPHLGSAVRSVRLEIERRAASNIIDVLEGRTPRDALNRIDAPAV